MSPLLQRLATFLPGPHEGPCEVEMICLTWSRKRGGRCMAGLRTDGGGWVRPVGDTPDGTLPEKPDARVLDVLRVSLGDACPKPHQPENWRLRRVWYNPWHRPWRLVARPAPEDIVARLETHLSEGPLLLGSRGDRVSEEQFQDTPAEESLALIQPEDLRWQIRANPSGERKMRAVFCWKGAPYNLAVTDPVWAQRLSDLGPGCHPHAAVGDDAGKTVLLTISLGEPYNGCCHKLVAAVIVLTDRARF
ncbi:MAG: hypothetical protein JO250_21280 [Armatimonadetes bacterium]|nr:hypothetical protein [Armatimonadota bacterium]